MNDDCISAGGYLVGQAMQGLHCLQPRPDWPTDEAGHEPGS